MTFPEIQMRCSNMKQNVARPYFRVKEGETGYPPLPSRARKTCPEPDRHFDLMWLQPTLRYESRTRVYVYSFYSNADIKQRIDAVFNAILHPEYPGEPIPADAEDGE